MANDERLRSVGDLEQAYKNVNTEFEKSKTKIQDLTTYSNTLKETQKELLEIAKQYKDVLKNSSDPKTIASLKEQQTIHKQVDDTIKKEITTKKDLEKTEKKLQQERLAELRLQKQREQAFDRYEKRLKSEQAAKERATKAAERHKKVILDESNAYKILVKQTDKAQGEYKRLAAQHGVNSKQAQSAKVKFDALDKSLVRINKEARDGRRDVGRYALAWNSAQSALGAVGVSIGIGFAAREGLEVLTEYDEKLADIRKTTGLSKKDASFVSEDLLKLDTKTSITNLQQLVEAGGRLNITGRKNLVDFAAAADQVFVALGDDLGGTADEIATNIGKISAQFGLEKKFGIAEGIKKAGSGINELAAKSKSSAPAILDFTNRMVGLSDVLELTDVQALGALFDESGQSIEVAATTLNKLLPSIATDYKRFAGIADMTPEAFKKIAEESPVEALKLVAQGAKNSEQGLFSLTSTLESYGVESARAVGIVGTLTNNVDRLTELQGISNKAIEEGTSLTDEFNVKNDTLSATIDKAKKKLQEQIIAFNNSTGFAKGLGNAIKFVTENLGTILVIGGKVLRFFIVYKTVMKANELLTGKFGTSLKGLVKGFKNLVSGGKSAIATLKGIGKALKGIGFGIALELLIESAAALWDIASGAKAAREALESLERANENAAANVERIVNRQSELFNKRMKELDLEIRTRIANGEDEKKLAKEKIEREKELASKTVESLKRTRAFKDAALAKTIQDEDRIRKFQAGELGNIQKNKSLWEEYNDLLQKYGGREKAAQMINERINRLTAESVSLNDSINEFQDVLNESTVQGIEEDSSGGSRGKGISSQNEKLKEQESLLRKIEDAENDLIKSELEREKQRLDIEVTRDIEDLGKSTAVESEKARLKELIIEQYLRDINQLEIDAQKAREERDKAELERLGELPLPKIQIPEAEDFGLGIEEDYQAERLRLLQDMSKSNEEVEGELSEFRIDLLEREIAIRKDLGIESAEFEIELAELIRDREAEIEAEKIENRKKWLSAGKEALENLGKASEAYMDDRIKEQEKIIASEEALLDAIQNSAEKGTLEQGQSIAAQQEKIAAAQEEKIRLEKQKQAIEFATAAITTFTSALEAGKTVPEAFADVALSQAGLELILNQLPKFFHGTEDTGTKGIFYDQFGAVTGVTHKNEGVLNADLNTKKKKAGLTNESMLDAAIRMVEIEKNPAAIDSNAYMQMLMMPQISTPVYDDDRLIKEVGSLKNEMRNVKKSIDNMKFPRSEMGRILGTGFSVIDSDGKGNSLETIIRNRRNG